MNKSLILRALVIASTAAACLAQVAPRPTAPPMPSVTPADRAARSNALARTGGMVRAPSTGPAVLILDTQKRVPETVLRDLSTHIQGFCNLPCAFKAQAAADPVADAAKALADKNNAAVVVICDTPNQPSLLVAPESRWALVNVAALGGADVPADRLADRVQKETWRAYGYLMGAANSSLEHCVMKPTFSPADLDANDCKTLSPEPFIKVMMQAQKMGLKATRMTSYRRAVEEGWAPQPTNDVQREIWKELRK